MRKRNLSLAMVICILCSFVPVIHAAEIVDSGTCGENVTWTLDDEGTLTISGTGKMRDYYGSPTFRGKNISSIVIEKGVSSIGEYAFEACDGLTSITIPDSVISIGEYAFEACDGLTSITIPDSVTSIGNYAFSDCSGLTSVTIPDSVTSIGNYAFSDCNGLTSVTIPNSITSINAYVFAYCKLLTNINIPSSVTSIGDWAFCGCESLMSISIPDSITLIGDNAFTYCSSLASINVDANNKNYTSQNGVLFNKNKTELICYPTAGNKDYNIPNSITSIANCAFQGCESLISLSIPDSVTLIGDWAFYGCKSLTSLNIPNSVTSIGIGVFEDCTSLTNINIPDSVTSISNHMFFYCESLISISIPNSVTSIEGWAFQGCKSLANISIPNSVTSIGAWAFSGCKSISNVYYSGTETEWKDLYTYILLYTSDFDNAAIHYNATSIPVPSVTSAEVTATDDGYTFDIDVSDIPYACELLTAVYDNGRLTGFATTPVTSADTQKTITVAADTADSAKVFIWDSAGAVKPLCEAVTADIE